MHYNAISLSADIEHLCFKSLFVFPCSRQTVSLNIFNESVCMLHLLQDLFENIDFFT